MSQRIVIDPVTRIEGHAKISLILDDQGEVSDARFHVVEFRGFEKFCEGRSFREMPGITSRICGICPVSHMLTSAKAGDELLAVEIPEGGTRLRRLIHYGQIPQTRDVIPGISRKERPSQNFSKPRNSTTWKRASETSPWSSRSRLILACPSMRVTGSMTMRWPMLAVSL